MGTDLNIGHVTAYAYAKSKGYTGTEEQFATELAQFAENAQQVAEDKEAVEQLVDEFLNTTAPAVIQDVTDEGTSQVERVANAGTAQVTRVGQSGDTQIDAVATEGTTQIGLVTAEGTTQVTRVQDKGDEVIDSIPSDYTELTQEVYDLNQHVNHLSDDLGLLIPVQRTNFCELVEGQALALGLEDIDPNFISFPNLNISISDNVATFSSHDSINSYLFRVPYKGFTAKFNARKVVVVDKIPTGTADEQLSVVEMLANNVNPTATTITFNYDAGTYVVVNISINASDQPFFAETDANGLYRSSRLELDSNQDTFARYSDRESESTIFGNTKLNIEKFTGKLPNGTSGAFSDNASYNTYVFRVPVNELSITCTNGFRCMITRVHPNDITLNGYAKQYVYANATSRVETFTANYGDYVEIGVAVSQGEINLKTDYIKPFKFPSLKLDYMQQDSFYKYESNSTSKYLYIYYKSGEKYVRWELHNVPTQTTNSNTWQIGHVCGFDANLGNMAEIVEGGEFEIALKEHGAEDYCGGNNHGDETTDSFVLHIDGKLISDLSALDNDYHAFNRIDAFEIATINRCNTPDEDIATHQKIWTFENGTVKVRQTLKFLEALSVDGWLCTMFKASRAAFPYGVRQSMVEIEDMHESPFSSPSTTANEVMYFMYGDHTSAKITAKTMAHTPEARLWIDDQSTANKLYYTFFGTNNAGNPASVAANSVYYWEQEYDVAYT